MNLYEAMFVRKTVRKYKMNPIDQTVLDGIMDFAKSLPALYQEIEVHYNLLKLDDMNHNFNGTFTVKAPYYLVITSEDAPGYLMNAGYLMQQISLYLTAKGLGSCYLGMLKPKKESIMESGFKYVITLAFGEGEHDIYRTSEKYKRLPIEDIAVFKSEVKKNIKTMIQAGRIAPSSMNSQPWRFVVYDNRIHVFCKKNFFLTGVLNEMKLIDIGVCLGNLVVAAEELWIDIKVTHMDNIGSIAFKKNDYILSLKMY
jgi:nitroreductase